MPAMYVSVTAIVDEDTSARANFNGTPSCPDPTVAVTIETRFGAPLSIIGTASEIDRILTTWATCLDQLRAELPARLQTAGVEP